MGKQVIILILAMVIIFGTVIVVMGSKQKDAVQRVSDLTLDKQARLLANNYAKQAVVELEKNLTNYSRADLFDYIQNNQSGYLIENLTGFTNASVTLTVDSLAFEGVVIPPNNYIVTATSRILSEDERTTYIAQTHIRFKHGFTPPTLPPPDTIDTGGIISGGGGNNLWVATDANGYMVIYTPNNNSHHNMSQGAAPPLANPNNSFPQNKPALLFTGGYRAGTFRIRFFNPITYDLNIIALGTIRIDGHIRANPGVTVRIYALEEILWGTRHQQSDTNWQIDAYLYTGMTAIHDRDYRPLSAIDIQNGGTAMNLSTIQWRRGGIGTQLNQHYSYQDFLNLIGYNPDDYVEIVLPPDFDPLDPDTWPEGFDPSDLIQGILSWDERPVQREEN
jgi:hypothetical protein